MPNAQPSSTWTPDQVLLIPEGLGGFAEARPVMRFGRNAIFHKRLNSSRHGVEFFTNAPCLCFVIRGQERFVTSDGAQIVTAPGDMILMPQNVFMISDFTGAEGPLEADLFFFDQAVLQEVLRRSPVASQSDAHPPFAYRIPAHDSLSAYMQALHAVYDTLKGSADLLQMKLVELLLLIAQIDAPERLSMFLQGCRQGPAPRNIRHLMKLHCQENLSVADYARLSGRSLAGFQREFKRQFGQSPGRWLIEKRLELAHAALLDSGASVTEIAQSVGYDSTSHFIEQFKKRYGQTPNRLRLAAL